MILISITFGNEEAPSVVTPLAAGAKLLSPEEAGKLATALFGM